ncbi:hypothetical protein HDU92_000380 [Lobulomyces angularis]|nr:hypothetical protein HDU92_000380 [Lobulomyces angularis]
MSETQPKPPSSSTNSIVQPLGARLSTLVLKMQFLWFFGHFATVTLGSIYILFFRFSSGGDSFYVRAYYGTLLSYAIILYKAHGTPQLSRAYLQRIMMDENTQYLLLAVVWFTSPPVFVSLIPYVTFSIFHVITFTRTEIIPTIQPPPFKPTAKKVISVLTKFTNDFQTKALNLVAYLEVWFIMPYLILTIFIGRTSILTPLLYGHFLRFRHFYSPLTKKSFRDLRIKLDGVFQNEKIPPFVKNVYTRLQGLITSLNVEHLQQQQQQAPPAQ